MHHGKVEAERMLKQGLPLTPTRNQLAPCRTIKISPKTSQMDPNQESISAEEITVSRWKRFTRTDGPWSWLLCLLLLTSCLVVYGCSSTYGIMFPGVLEELQSGKAITAIPGSLSLANSGLLGPITGQFYDRFGCTRAMLLGGSISFIGLFTSSFAPNSGILILTFGMIFGSGLSLVFLSSLLVIPEYFKKYAFQATSLVSVGPGAALLVMSPVVQRLFQTFGWRKSMKVMSGLAFCPCIVGLMMCAFKGKEVPTRHSYTERNRQNSDLEPSKTRCNGLINVSVFKNKVYVLTSVMVTITSLGHMMPFVHLAKYCEDIGIPSDHSSWIYFSIGLSSLLSRVLVGKYGNTSLITLPHIYQLGAYILAVGNLLLPSLNEFYLLIMYGIVNGVGEGLVFTSSLHIVLDSLPSRGKGVAYGIYVFFVSLSYAAGSPFSGLIADVTGFYSYSFYTAGSLEVVGSSLQFLSRFLHKNNEEKDVEHSSQNLIVTEKETVS
ncbi:monocarboxylate transporter 10-like [Actinia tenebrosa]|uniref:Monocarboxylate transporter 10-like n=1 Tax=Actinia tenebrosa TaxID=6105 RepID=A0A6P8IED3_ACTTE|nr:monocarboxylate transporter 10-like [Actinia tenebrosa]